MVDGFDQYQASLTHVFFNLTAIVFFGICWGATIPLTKVAIEAGHHPLGLIFWQMVIAAFLLGGYLLFRRELVVYTFVALKYYFIIAVIGTLIPNTFSLIAMDHLPAGIMAIIIATVPIMSLLVALIARIEQFSWARFMGVLLGVSALVLISLPEASLPYPGNSPWLLVSLIAPLCYAIEGNVVAARTPIKLSPMVTLFGASVLGSALLLPVVTMTDMSVSLVTPWDKSRWAIVGSAVGHVTAYCGYLFILSRAGAVFTSQIGYVVSLTGIVGAVVFLGESYGSTVWFAVSLMLVGVALVRPISNSASSALNDIS